MTPDGGGMGWLPPSSSGVGLGDAEDEYAAATAAIPPLLPTANEVDEAPPMAAAEAAPPPPALVEEPVPSTQEVPLPTHAALEAAPPPQGQAKARWADGWTRRLHPARDDAAAAVVHIRAKAEAPPPAGAGGA